MSRGRMTLPEVREKAAWEGLDYLLLHYASPEQLPVELEPLAKTMRETYTQIEDLVGPLEET